MQYNLTHRGNVIATVEADDRSELKIERAKRDTLPPMPEGYSQLEDVRKAQSRPCPWHQPSRGRKHSTRASTWL